MRFLCVNQSGHGGAARTTGLVRRVLACCLVALGLSPGIAGAQTPQVNFLFEQVEVGESVAGATATLTVVAEPAPASNIDVGYRFLASQSSAAAPADFSIAGLTGNAGSVQLTPAAPRATLTVTLVNDSVDEGLFEDALFELLGDTAGTPRYNLGVLFGTRLRIYDDDGAGSRAMPRLSFSRAESSGIEGTTVNVEVRATPPPAGALTISYAAMPAGTATSGADYTALSGSLTLAANAGSVTLPVVLSNDGNHEPTESLLLLLQAGSGYTLGSRRRHQLTIGDATDNLPQISFMTPASTVAEQPGEDTERDAIGRLMRASTTITLNVAPAPYRPIWVGYRVAPASTASAGPDYLGLPAPGVSGSLRIEAGQSRRDIVLSIPPDRLREGTETLMLELLSPPTDDYVLGAGTAHTLSITDDSDDGSLPLVRFGSAQAVEVNDGSVVDIPLLANGLDGATLSVSLEVDRAQTSAESSDYTLPAATMISTATGTVVRLQTHLDADLEDEVLVLQIADSSAYETARERFADARYLIRMRDTGLFSSGPAVQFVSAGSIAEEPDPRSTATLAHQVTLERDNTAGSLTVTLAVVARGAAVDGVDYSVPSTTVTFIAGQARANATVTIRPDDGITPAGIQQGEQVVEMLLLPGSGYQLGAQIRHRVTISEQLVLTDHTDGMGCTLQNDPGRSCLEATEGDVLSFNALLATFHARDVVTAFNNVPLDVHFCVDESSNTGIGTDRSNPNLDFIVLNAVEDGRCTSATHPRTEVGDGPAFRLTLSPGQTGVHLLVEIVDDDVPERDSDRVVPPGMNPIAIAGDNRLDGLFHSVPGSFVFVSPARVRCNAGTRSANEVCIITDNDPAPPPTPSVAFDAATTVVDENAGTVSIPLTVTDPPAQGMVIDYRIAGGSAQPGADYTIDGVPAATRRGSLAVPPAGTAGIDLWLTDDRIPGEPDRSLVLELQPRGDAYTLGAQASHSLTIEDDDVAGALTGVSFAVGQLEVNEGGGSVTVQVRAVPPTAAGVIPGGSFNIPYRLVTAETTAPASLYTISGGSTGTLSFSDSQRTRELTVTLNDNSDEDTQPTRSLVLELLQPQPVGDYLVVAPNQVRIVINDDDGANMPVPRINFSLVESGGTEGDTVNVEVVSIPSPAAPLTISYNAMPAGTATSVEDYTALSGSLTLTTGSALLPVILTDDGVPEPPESLVLMLQAGSGYTLGSRRRHRLDIEDNDLPVISFAQATSSVAEPEGEEVRSGGGILQNVATIVLNVVQAPHRPIWVGYRVNAAGSASAGPDYLGLPAPGETGSLRFEAGEASRSVVLSIPSDPLREGTETLILELLDPTDDYTLGTQTSHTLSITDSADDGSLPVVRFGSSAPVDVDEGGTVNIPLLVNALEGATLSVSLQVDGGQSTAEDTDYTLPAATMVSTATGTMVQLQTNADADTDDEVLVLQIADSAGNYVTSRDRFADTSYVVRIRDTGATASGPMVQFVSAGSLARENRDGSTAVTHTLALERTGATTGTLSVMVAAVGRGDAVAGATDFSLPSTTVTFAIGQARTELTVTVNSDNAGAGGREGEQLVDLLLLPGSSYQLGERRHHRVTITEGYRLGSSADCLLTDESSCAGANEGDVLVFRGTSLIRDFSFPGGNIALLNAPTDVPIDIYFCVANGIRAGDSSDARDGLDFIVLNGMRVPGGRCRAGGNGFPFLVTVPPGQVRPRVLVEIVDDDVPDANRLQAALLAAPNTVVLEGTTTFPIDCFRGPPPPGTVVTGPTCFITDNDEAPPPTPSVAFATATSSQLEDAGTVSIPLTVADPPAAGLVIDYQVTGGDAQLNADYTIDGLDEALRAQTVVTDAGGSININLLDDGQSLPDVTLELTLLAPTGAEAAYVPGGVARHILTIANDDAAVSPPVPVGSLPAQRLVAGGAPASVDVSTAFRDPNEGDVLTYSALSDAEAVATVSVSGAIVSITPVAAGSATVTVTARDPGGLTAEQTIAVTVAPSPVPVFAADTVADQTYLRLRPVTPLTLPAADGGVGALSYGLAPLPAGFSFDPAARVLSGTPTAAVGQTTLTYTVTDTDGNSARQTFIIILQELAATTIGGAISATITEDGAPTTGGTVRVLDSNGVAIDSATFSTTGGLVGTYGSFSPLTMGGGAAAWVYTLNNDSTLVQQLPAGATPQDTLALQAVAGGGFPNPPAIMLTAVINGADDPTAVTFTAPAAGMLVESGATIAVTGALTDADAGETPSGAITYLWSTAPAGQGSFANATAAGTMWTVPTTPPSDGNIELRLQAMLAGETFEGGVGVIVDAPPRFSAAVTILPRIYQRGIPVLEVLPQATGGNGALSYRIEPALPQGLSFDPARRFLSGTPAVTVAETDYTYIAADSDANTAGTDEARLPFTLEIPVDSAPSFSAAAMLGGTLEIIAGAPSSLTLPEAMGGNGALSYRLTGRSLPNRLSFDPATRVLGGFLLGSGGRSQHTYIAADSDTNTAATDEARQTFTITGARDRSPSFLAAPPLIYRVAQVVNQTLPTATGGNLPLTYDIVSGTLPTGLSFEPSTRLLSGTVRQGAGPPVVLQYQVRDLDGDTAQLDVSIQITAPAASISATDPNPLTDTGLDGATLTVTLGAGAYVGASALRADQFGLLTDAAGVEVASFNRDNATAVTLTLGYDGTLLRQNEPLIVTILAAAHTGSDNLGAGPVTIQASNPAPLAPVLAEQTATEANAFSYTFDPVTDPNGDTVAISAALAGGGSLPGWLRFDAASRTFSGTPAAADAGTLSIRVTATDDGTPPMSTTADFTLTVFANTPPEFGVSALTDQSFAVNGTVNLTLPAATGGNGNLSYTLADADSALPLGLTFNAVTRVLSGTPTELQAAADYTYAVTDADGDRATLMLSIAVGVNTPPVWIPEEETAFDRQIFEFTAGVDVVNLTLPQATGGNGELRYRPNAFVNDPSDDDGLPAFGLILTDSEDLPFPDLSSGGRTCPCVISGSATRSGTNRITIPWIVVDSDGIETDDSDALQFRIEIRPRPSDIAPTFGSDPRRAGIDDQVFTMNQPLTPLTLPAAGGGDGALSYSLEDGSGGLPAGLSFDAATRVLSGTPTATQVATDYSYTVGDADGNTGAADTDTLIFAITVEVALALTAAITASNPAVLTETNLNGATLTVTLSLAEYMVSLNTNQFTLVTGIAGLTVASLNRDSATAVTLTLAHTDTLTMNENIGVTVAAAAHTGTAPLTTTNTVTVTDNTAPVITAPGAQSYTQGSSITPLPISVTDAESDALTVTLAPLPPGLTFEPGPPRQLVGTPTTGGITSVTISADDGVNPAVTATFDITVMAVALRFGAVASIPAQRYFVNSATELTLPPAFGGTAPLIIGISPPLPTGLSFDAITRVLSGTPTVGTEQDATDYTYTVTDSATPPALISLDFTIEVLPEVTVADLDLNRDSVIDSEDALGLYFAYQFESTLGDGDSGGSAASRRNLLARVASGGSRTLDDAGRQALVRDARFWQIAGLNLGGGLSGDLNGDGAIDVNDALGMYIAYTFELDVGTGASGGTSTNRQNLLSEVADGGDLPSSDQGRQTFLMRANALRNAL